MTNIGNVLAIARREYLVRVRTRTFALGTLLLVAAIIGVALLPVIFRWIDRTGPLSVAVFATDELVEDPVARLELLLNAPNGNAQPSEGRRYVVIRVTDLPTARRAVVDGDLVAVLAIERDADGELQFRLYTDDPDTGGIGLLATTSLAVADRLDRYGVDPSAQAGLFAPARYSVEWPDPDRSGPGPDRGQLGTDYLLGFGLTMLIFMLIVLYGNWIAMSVVEEKSSRVMEVILNAATPFQLLAGKVLGVGALALTQYAAILAAGVVALLVQAPLASFVLGDSGGGVGLPTGLTIGMLLMLGLFGVLGFLLYGVLYAAAGSLVSRQDDVQAAVMPLAIVSTGAYLVSVYTATGLLDIPSGWLAVLAQVPFMSPFLMLSRVSAGEASPPEVVLSVVLLVASIGGALWIAARIYAAGVLLYGQRPGIHSLWRLARTGM